MIKCVIFDLDGTLLNTLEDLCDSTNYALSAFGYPARSIDEVKNFVGNGVRLLIERALPNGNNNPDFEKCLTEFKTHYKNNMYNKTKPYPEIIEMLETLKSQNIKTAVVSNKFNIAVKDLCEKYFPNLIDIAIGENEQKGIRKKPAPDSVLKVISELNLNKEQVIYVGDSETDIQTAKNAGVDCVACAWGFRDVEVLIKNKPKYIINTPKELLNLI